MTGYNHVATGAIIALSIKEPAIALPLAFASHFVLDALPHYGADFHQRKKYPAFLRIVGTDLVLTPLAIVLVSLLAHSWLVFGAMLLAICPDIVWFGKYYYDWRKNLPFQLPQDVFSRFHKRIQWAERSDALGMGIELATALLATAAIIALV